VQFFLFCFLTAARGGYTKKNIYKTKEGLAKCVFGVGLVGGAEGLRTE